MHCLRGGSGHRPDFSLCILKQHPDSGDYFDEFGDYDSGYYVPDEDDPYYREITDCTRTDLEYGISWIVDSITPDDDEDYCTYYATYPLLKGGDGAYDSINEEITGKALQYKEAYTDYPGGCSTYGYVTYMDEEMISIVFQHSLYGDQGTLPRVSALTFDLETGELLEPGEMITVDEELVMRFRSQNQTQNGAVAYLDNLSDEAFLSILNDPDQSFYFYSPVGLEAGFNYESEEYGRGRRYPQSRTAPAVGTFTGSIKGRSVIENGTDSPYRPAVPGRFMHGLVPDRFQSLVLLLERFRIEHPLFE